MHPRRHSTPLYRMKNAAAEHILHQDLSRQRSANRYHSEYRSHFEDTTRKGYRTQSRNRHHRRSGHLRIVNPPNTLRRQTLGLCTHRSNHDIETLGVQTVRHPMHSLHLVHIMFDTQPTDHRMQMVHTHHRKPAPYTSPLHCKSGHQPHRLQHTQPRHTRSFLDKIDTHLDHYRYHPGRTQMPLRQDNHPLEAFPQALVRICPMPALLSLGYTRNSLHHIVKHSKPHQRTGRTHIRCCARRPGHLARLEHTSASPSDTNFQWMHRSRRPTNSLHCTRAMSSTIPATTSRRMEGSSPV